MKILTIATAGLKPGQMTNNNHTRFGRVDYLELRQHINADILNYDIYNKTRLGNLFRKLEIQLRSDLYLALLGIKQQRSYDLIFTMSERAGIPIAASRKYIKRDQKFVTMFQSWSWRQELAVRRLNLVQTMDCIFVHCTSMRELFLRLGAKSENVYIVPYSVDHKFFSPQTINAEDSNTVVSIGETRSRNYDLLFRAVKNLPVELKIAAGGSWYAREKNRHISNPLPPNVFLTGYLAQKQLRDLYARSRFVILPVHDLIYSAGSTGAMEAASMGKAVIATRSRGIIDFIIDGETGILVEPEDEYAMKKAIEYLLGNPHEAERMGKNARNFVEEKHNFDIYVARMANLLLKYAGVNH